MSSLSFVALWAVLTAGDPEAHTYAADEGANERAAVAQEVAPETERPKAAPEATEFLPQAPDGLKWLQTTDTTPLDRRLWPLCAGISLCVTAALLLYVRRLRSTLSSLGSGAASIEVLAIRALGPKHRLALVETCGERLLLSASEREVSLLSHLSPEPLVDAPSRRDGVAHEMADGGDPLVSARTLGAPSVPVDPASAASRPALVDGPRGAKKAAASSARPPQRAPRRSSALEASALEKDEGRALTLDDIGPPDEARPSRTTPKDGARGADDAPERDKRAYGKLSSDVAGLAHWRANQGDDQSASRH